MNIERYFTANDTQSMPMGIGYEDYNTNYWQRLTAATTPEQLISVADDIYDECKNNPLIYMEFAICLRYNAQRLFNKPLYSTANELLYGYFYVIPKFDHISYKIIDNSLHIVEQHCQAMKFYALCKENEINAVYLTADGSNDELGVLLEYHSEQDRQWMINYIGCVNNDGIVSATYEDNPQWYVDMCNASGCRCMYGCMDVRFRI